MIIGCRKLHRYYREVLCTFSSVSLTGYVVRCLLLQNHFHHHHLVAHYQWVWNSGIISWQESPEKLVYHLSIRFNVLKKYRFQFSDSVNNIYQKTGLMKNKRINKGLYCLWLFIHICVTLDELTLKCHILSYGPTAHAWYSSHPPTPTPHPGDRNLIALDEPDPVHRDVSTNRTPRCRSRVKVKGSWWVVPSQLNAWLK